MEASAFQKRDVFVAYCIAFAALGFITGRVT